MLVKRRNLVKWQWIGKYRVSILGRDGTSNSVIRVELWAIMRPELV